MVVSLLKIHHTNLPGVSMDVQVNVVYSRMAWRLPGSEGHDEQSAH